MFSYFDDYFIPYSIYLIYYFYVSLGVLTGKPGEVTFKDVVETYAADNGITFMPKKDRTHEGKQIWLFGKSLCYLDIYGGWLATVSIAASDPF